MLLLTESLPYISELQEDDNHEVVGCTRELVTAIEDMTGEKLDEYLK